MGNLKLLDLFSGIGGFSIAAERAGIETVAFCEIDKFPQSVLKHHYPHTPIINDVCQLTKESFKSATGLDSVDIICGGSPCQSFSVAGKREGLKGASGIFYEYARIIKELSPKYVVWENVPGVLSSGEGRDFERVLCAFTGHDSIEFTKWGTCGYFKGKQGYYNVAYRIFDSRYFGVPQRRRRIFLVGSLGDDSCAKILFEQESVRGNITQSEKSRKDAPAFVESSFGGFRQSELGQTLTTSGGSIGNGGETIVLDGKQTLFENHSQDSRYEQKDISPTITSRAGTDGLVEGYSGINGVNPKTKVSFVGKNMEKRRIASHSMVCSVPKSVSLLAAACEQKGDMSIYQAHDDAVAYVLKVLEENFAYHYCPVKFKNFVATFDIVASCDKKIARRFEIEKF